MKIETELLSSAFNSLVRSRFGMGSDGKVLDHSGSETPEFSTRTKEKDVIGGQKEVTYGSGKVNGKLFFKNNGDTLNFVKRERCW